MTLCDGLHWGICPGCGSGDDSGQLTRWGSFEKPFEDGLSLFGRGPSRLCVIVQNACQHLRMKQLSVVNGIAQIQFIPRGLAEHLIEEKVTQAIGDESRPIVQISFCKLRVSCCD